MLRVVTNCVLTIYNSLNNIKFTKEKKIEKKNLLSTWFIESKVPYKKKGKKNKEKSLHDAHSKY